MIIVTGLPRSGTSLMMQTLDLMGLNIIGDKIHKDEYNKKGYFESSFTITGLDTNNYFGEDVVKVILSSLIKKTKLNSNDKVIFCLRHPYQVAYSQSNTGFGSERINRNKRNYSINLQKFLEWKDVHDFDLLIVDYDNFLMEPDNTMNDIFSFLNMEAHLQICEKIKSNLDVDDSINTYKRFRDLQ